MNRLFNQYNTDFHKYYDPNKLKIPKNIDVLNIFLNMLSNNLFWDENKIGNLIGVGYEGQVYDIVGEDKVIKIQETQLDDLSDLNTLLYLKNKDIKGVAKIHEIKHIVTDIELKEFNKNIFYIILDKVTINNDLYKLFSDIEFDYLFIKSHKIYSSDIDGDAFLGYIDDYAYTNPKEITEFINKIKDKTNKKNVAYILDILTNLYLNHNIKMGDLMVKNFGFDKDNNLSIFDINGYFGKEVFDIDAIII